MGCPNAYALLRGRTMAIAIVAVLALGFLILHPSFVWRWMPRRWGVVEPGRIFRSGQLHPRLIEETLRKHGIQAIINLSHRQAKWRPEEEAAERLGARVTYIPMKGDGTTSPETYAKAVAEVDRCVQADQPVLIHCSAGVHRTGAVVALYRLLIQGVAPGEVLREMEANGCSPKRDAALFRCLDEGLQATAEHLVRCGILEKVPDPLPLIGAGNPKSEITHPKSKEGDR